MNNTAIKPAVICIGSTEETVEFATRYLQNILCSHRARNQNAPCRCTTCHGILTRQTTSVTWIWPEQDYVLHDIDPIFDTIRYQLDPGTAHAFVLVNAHLLSAACANRLLKVMEEPPHGYFFLLLTDNETAILPTIKSRCAIIYQTPNHTPPLTGLLSYFLDSEKQQDPAGLDAFLRSEQISAASAALLVHQLAVNIDCAKYPDPVKVREIIDHASRRPPQAGGAAHYLRWVFMALHAARFPEES